MYHCKDTGEKVSTYYEYLNTEHWKNIKQIMYKKYRYECCVCGSHFGVSIHHKTYKNVGNEPLEDLVYMCRSCHKLYHDNDSIFNGVELTNTPRGGKHTIRKQISQRELKKNKEWAKSKEEDVKKRMAKSKNKRNVKKGNAKKRCLYG